MNTSTMHTYEHVKELTDAGMPENQAEIVVRQRVETKDDLVTKQHFDLTIELLKTNLTLKLGILVVSGLAATIGIILAVVSMMLSNLVV